MTEPRATLTILRLGAQGDGVAEHEGRQVFVPFALPGEVVEAEVEGDRARVVAIVTPSPDRMPPRCSHYGECGGCSLQHLPLDRYLKLKRDLVTTALSFQGVDAAVGEVVRVPPASRRRAVFAAHRAGKDIVVGFHGRRSHHIVGVKDCAVLTPALVALIPQLATLAAGVAPVRDALTITATETESGFDVALTGAPKGMSADARRVAAQTAEAMGLARLSINGAIEMERVAPALRIGAAVVTPPPGGFLQACRESEAEMLGLVQEAVAGAERIVDLFAGVGTFALPLAASAAVHAVESEEASIRALGRAAKKTTGIRPVTTEVRDLFRSPLDWKDLKRFDAAVIDPPRAGAEAQTRELASSSLTRIAMVSCNATTFARDLKILVAAGWRVTRITPVDQFIWSPHIEIVAALERGSA
jgi:23S rRNA (uracil1939-C5)-methyltransferase